MLGPVLSPGKAHPVERFDVPVLIVGGGGCGLMSSICLSDMGVPSLLVERHPDTSHLPKAHYLNQRTMEIFRQHGFADAIYAAGSPMSKISCVRWCTSLGGDGPLDRRVIHRMDAFGGGALAERYARDSGCPSSNLPQIRLEPLLRREAESRELAQVRFGHELVSFEQDETGVTAEIRDHEGKRTFSVRAQYLIGADGGKTVGAALGVDFTGPRRMMEMVTAHFSADLSPHIDDDGAMIHWFLNPEGEGTWASGALVPMGPTWGRDSEEWYLVRAVHPDDPDRYDAESSIARVRELLRLPDLEAEVHRISHWVLDAIVADRYQVGRVFLAGDAAHRHPPTTGLGLNTAIGDAHNLAWKLAAIVQGTADPALADTYETERRPVGERNAEWALMTWFNHPVNDVAMGLLPGQSPDERKAALTALFAEGPMGETRRAKFREVINVQRLEFQAHDVELGYAYTSDAVVADGSEPPPRDPMALEYHPTTRPGHRLPHAWLEHDGARRATHDLVAPGRFLLLAGRDADAWMEQAAALGDDGGAALDAVQIGSPSGQLSDRAIEGLTDDGAVLVRPDGHVGWRTAGPPDGDAALSAALSHVLSAGAVRARA
jgi:2,4-dichlorophenol 6-monooxygenase